MRGKWSSCRTRLTALRLSGGQGIFQEQRSRRRFAGWQFDRDSKTIIGISAPGMIPVARGRARCIDLAQPGAAAQDPPRFIGKVGVGLFRIRAGPGVRRIPIPAPLVDITADIDSPRIGLERHHGVGAVPCDRLEPGNAARSGRVVPIVPCGRGSGATGVFPLRFGRQAARPVRRQALRLAGEPQWCEKST